MLQGLIGGLLGGLVIFFAATPTSTNYTLKSYEFGSGGTDASTSTNYSLNGTTGTVTGSQLSSASYRLNGGNNPTQNANVPPAPTLTNPSSYYDRLQLVLNTGNNPSDTKYLIAISPDAFVTTRYVQLDNSIGTTNTLGVYRTYASYGGASGFLILGLAPSTSYQVAVKAIQGKFSETGFGPATSGVATVSQSLSFGLTTTLTATPPFTVNFPSLVSGSVVTSNADANLSISTNALNGGAIYVQGKNNGLLSASAAYTITSTSVDLATVNGYGGQVISSSQTSGGPISIVAPFNGISDNVGAFSSAVQTLLSTPSPITGGSGVLRIKARIPADTPAATDYTDTLTLTAAMNY